MEQTLVLVKPDGVQRGLVGEVISRLERRGLKLVALKLMQVDDALARRHYGEHVDRPFFAGLVQFITSAPVAAMVWQADNAVEGGAQHHGRNQPGGGGSGNYTGRLWLGHRSEPCARVGQCPVGRAGSGPVFRFRGDPGLLPEHRPLDQRGVAG